MIFIRYLTCDLFRSPMEDCCRDFSLVRSLVSMISVSSGISRLHYVTCTLERSFVVSSRMISSVFLRMISFLYSLVVFRISLNMKRVHDVFEWRRGDYKSDDFSISRLKVAVATQMIQNLPASSADSAELATICFDQPRTYLGVEMSTHNTEEVSLIRYTCDWLTREVSSSGTSNTWENDARDYRRDRRWNFIDFEKKKNDVTFTLLSSTGDIVHKSISLKSPREIQWACVSTKLWAGFTCSIVVITCRNLCARTTDPERMIATTMSLSFPYGH